MTWLDRVLALPTVGALFIPELHSDEEYFQRLKPFLEKRKDENSPIGIANPEPLKLAITKDGFQYLASPDNYFVRFNYSHEIQDVPGQRPMLKYHSDLEQYSVLLKEVMDEASEFLDHILGSEKRELIRIGIMATVRIDGQAPPPGVATFLSHLTTQDRGDKDFSTAIQVSG